MWKSNHTTFDAFFKSQFCVLSGTSWRVVTVTLFTVFSGGYCSVAGRVCGGGVVR